MMRRQIKANLLLLSALYVVFTVHQTKWQNESNPPIMMGRSLLSFCEEYLWPDPQGHYNNLNEE